jgi:hypothetical protein
VTGLLAHQGVIGTLSTWEPYALAVVAPLGDVVLPLHIARRSFRGSLAHWPRLDPQDFERASQLAAEDADHGLTAGA